jgi:hypothetical protein
MKEIESVILEQMDQFREEWEKSRESALLYGHGVLKTSFDDDGNVRFEDVSLKCIKEDIVE